MCLFVISGTRRPPQLVACVQSLWKTRNHLFYTCSYSEEIWKTLTQGLLSSQYTNEWESLLQLLTDQTRSKVHLFLLRYVFQATLSTIWMERNGSRHGEKPNNPYQTYWRGGRQKQPNRISSMRLMRDRKHSKAMETWFSVR